MTHQDSHAGSDLAGARVTVMGLGLFGGGVAAARWAHAHGARVCVTDLRDAETLAPSLEAPPFRSTTAFSASLATRA